VDVKASNFTAIVLSTRMIWMFKLFNEVHKTFTEPSPGSRKCGNHVTFIKAQKLKYLTHV
jgi:hypothetical protein